jgi:Mg-chelatase subunit ChlI
VLYVDEVNLLDDHIVDLLLDCAASGVNVVAREGVAVAHPAEFMLVGTMNPEEGELRPQLQDRFGLCAEIRTLQEPESRAEIVDRVLEFEHDPGAFDSKWAKEEKRLSESISKARKLLPTIEPDRGLHMSAAELSISLGVHGHRADFLMIKASATLAALDGRTEINIDDLQTAATLVYPHRLRRKPFDESPLSEEALRERTREILSGSKPEAAQKKSPPKEPA